MGEIIQRSESDKVREMIRIVMVGFGCMITGLKIQLWQILRKVGCVTGS